MRFGARPGDPWITSRLRMDRRLKTVGLLAGAALSVCLFSTLSGYVSTVAAQQAEPPTAEVEVHLSRSNVELGQSLDVTFSMHGLSGSGDHGGLSISFPHVQDPGKSGDHTYSSYQADVRLISYSGDDSRVTFFDPGDTLHEESGSTMGAVHLLVEFDEPSWTTSSVRTITLRISPRYSRQFEILYRQWVCADGYDNCSRIGSEVNTYDQQGWRAHVLTVNITEPPVTDDHGGTFDDATRVRLDRDYDGNIEIDSDRDVFWFDAESGTRYVITAIPESISDTRIYVYDPDNEQLGKDEDGGAARVVLDPAPKSGRYHISVRGEMLNDAGAGPIGTYELRVSSISDDHDGVFGSATRIETGRAYSGAIEIDSDRDVFWFDAESGTRYVITVTPESISDTRIYVYDPDSGQLGKDEDGGAARVVLDPAPKSGRYHISVRGEMLNDAGAGPIGTYELRVEVINPVPPEPRASDRQDTNVVQDDFLGELDHRWLLLGSAEHSTDWPVLVLTRADNNQLGALASTVQQNLRRFRVEFSFSIGEGTGADGLAFWVSRHLPVELDPQDRWHGFGSHAFDGYSVEFDTWWNADLNDPSNNHVGLNRLGGTLPVSLAASGLDQSLSNSGSFTAEIEFDGGHVTVHLTNPAIGMERTLVLEHTIPGYDLESGYFGFVAATGAAMDWHVIDRVDFRAGDAAQLQARPELTSPIEQEGDVIWSGTASEIALSGNFGVTVDPDVRVSWHPADPATGIIWPFLEFSISGSRSVAGTGSLTVAVPKTAWVAFDFAQVVTVDSAGQEMYLDQHQIASISDFHSSVGRLFGAIPGVGGVLSVLQGIGEVFGEDTSPRSPLFADPDSGNCFTFVSIPWAVDPTLQGGPFHRVTVRVPFVNLESSDTVGLYSGFSVGASTLASAVGGGADAAGAIEIEDLFDSGGSTACPGPSDFVWVPIDVYTDDYSYQFIDSGLLITSVPVGSDYHGHLQSGDIVTHVDGTAYQPGMITPRRRALLIGERDWIDLTVQRGGDRFWLRLVRR